jgi:hypothetical protein
MTADTEREVVIVQNADVFPVEKEDILNRREGKGEVPADADITGLSRLGDAVRIGGAQEIDGQLFVTKAPWRAKRDFVDRLESVQIALCIIAFDDEAVVFIGEDEIADRNAARVELILEAVSRVAAAREIELVPRPYVLLTPRLQGKSLLYSVAPFRRRCPASVLPEVLKTASMREDDAEYAPRAIGLDLLTPSKNF